MQESEPLTPAQSNNLETSLHALSERLRDAEPLGPEAQRALADLLDELARSLQPAAVRSEESSHLAESSSQLAETLKRPRDRGALAAAIRRLEGAVLRAEAEAPAAAGFARQMLDILANFGI